MALKKGVTLLKVIRFTVLVLVIVLGSQAAVWPQQEAQAARSAPITTLNEAKQPALISPYWPEGVQKWQALIYKIAFVSGVDPDLVAAVVLSESHGLHEAVSPVGAVGLMGVMPQGPGMEWRPTSQELLDPETNIRWGVAILTDIMRQAGGDLGAALAAYNGGWTQVHLPITQAYANKVLDNYGRAVMTRIGASPDLAYRWTIAVEMQRGHVPNQPLLVLGHSPADPSRIYGGHMVYNFVSPEGEVFYIKGYAVPVLSPKEVALAQPVDPAEPHISKGGRNPRLLIACLPSLSRLRGHLSTRWFAPSTCPAGRR